MVIDDGDEVLFQGQREELREQGIDFQRLVGAVFLNVFDRRLLRFLEIEMEDVLHVAEQIARGDRADVMAVIVDDRDDGVFMDVKDLDGLAHRHVLIEEGGEAFGGERRHD